MRDPARIPRILNKLQTLWEKHPDLRLGQLMHVLFSESNLKDSFYIEDDKTEEYIGNFDKKYSAKAKEEIVVDPEFQKYVEEFYKQFNNIDEAIKRASKNV